MSGNQGTVESVVLPAAPDRPEDYDAATRAALDHIGRQAVRTVADGRPERTRTGYAQDWVCWTKFCAASGVPLLAVTPGTLVMFVEWLWTQPRAKQGTCTAPSTIDRRLSGTVVSARAEHGLKLEDCVARLARNRLKQLVKEMEASGENRDRGQAPPLLVEHLVRIGAACPDNLMGLRDRALVLMHFAVAGRKHELAFNRIRDYAATPGGIQADLRVSKVRPRVVPSPTAPAPRSARSAPGRHGRRPPASPIRTATPGAACTTAGTPSWTAAYSPSPSATSFTRAGERAGIGIRFTGHSPRRRLATSSRHKGHDQIVIAKQGGWAPTPRSWPATSKSSTSGRTTPCSACCEVSEV